MSIHLKIERQRIGKRELLGSRYNFQRSGQFARERGTEDDSQILLGGNGNRHFVLTYDYTATVNGVFPMKSTRFCEKREWLAPIFIKDGIIGSPFLFLVAYVDFCNKRKAPWRLNGHLGSVKGIPSGSTYLMSVWPSQLEGPRKSFRGVSKQACKRFNVSQPVVKSSLGFI